MGVYSLTKALRHLYQFLMMVLIESCALWINRQAIVTTKGQHDIKIQRTLEVGQK